MPEPRFSRAVRLSPLALLVLLAGVPTDGGAQPEPPTPTTYLLQSSVLGIAGAPGTSQAFRTNGTLGQSTPIGIGVTTDWVLYAGFWSRLLVPTVAVIPYTPSPFGNFLLQNTPNPFNTATSIDYSVADHGLVEVKVFDIGGRLVRTLVSHSAAPGVYRATWDTRDQRGVEVASGIYFYRLTTSSHTFVKKMLILR